MEDSGDAKPLSTRYASCGLFCDNGEFARQFFHNIRSLFYADVVYSELEAQYNRFVRLTNREANMDHVDFHFYGNLSFPNALAYRRFIRNYHIRSARYSGAHHHIVKKGMKKAALWIYRLLNGHGGEIAKSSGVDYWLHRKEEFNRSSYIEMYVHPNIRDGKMIDQTESVFHKEFRSMKRQIELVSEFSGAERISWRNC